MNQGTLDARITVQYVNPPKAGKKRGTIKDADGNIYGVFPDKIGLFQPGSTYDVEIRESQVSNELFRNIVDGVLCGRRKTMPAATPSGRKTQSVNSIPTTDTTHYVPAGNTSKDQQLFVLAILKSLIEAGEIHADQGELVNAVQTLREVWRQTFGNG